MQSIYFALVIVNELLLDVGIQRARQAYGINVKPNPHRESRLANGRSTDLSSASTIVNPGPNQRALCELTWGIYKVR